MASLSKGTSFTDGVTGDVTAAKLHALVDAATPVGGLISDRTAKTSVAIADTLLLGDSADSGNLKKITVSNLVGNLPTASITTGTILTATLGTTTGTSAIFTSGTLTTGVIPTATLGTTTGTAATFTIGTIPTLTAGTTTSTAANITNGTVQTLTASTGTITNLTTTLAGDFTISSGTATLGTTGVTAGTYGTSTIIPQIAVDAKGRVTSVGTSAVSTGKILQVVSASVTGGSGGFSTTSQSYVDVTGLTANITPASSSNKVLVTCMVNGLGVYPYFKIVRVINGTPTDIGVGTSYGSRVSSTMALNSSMNTGTINLIDSPASTSQITYKLQIRLSSYPTNNIYRLNVTSWPNDTDSDETGITTSGIILTEISA